MASKAKMIGSTEATQPETAVEKREVLLRSTREEEIRNRAYEIYLQRGGQPGYELEDWLQAERELTNESSALLQLVADEGARISDAVCCRTISTNESDFKRC